MELRRLHRLLLPTRRLGRAGQSSGHSSADNIRGFVNTDENARLKHSSGCSGCDPGATLKLIKEDHFACTTRMFEILVPFSSNAPGKARRLNELGGICCPDHPVHQGFRTHILAAIRLFTCQRAFASKSDSEILIEVRRRFFRKRRWQLSLPSS